MLDLVTLMLPLHVANTTSNLSFVLTMLLVGRLLFGNNYDISGSVVREQRPVKIKSQDG